MPRSPNQRQRIFYLLKLFVEQSSAENTFTIEEMILYLQKFSIKADRRTIYSDIETFREFGYDIIGLRGKGYAYYLGSRTFELAELKLLADAVACSKFISERKSRKLIQKIGTLASKGEADQLEREVIVANRVKSTNERVFYNVDMLHRAIVENRQVSFLYFDYGIDKRKQYRRGGSRYLVSPYALTWETENYYLLCDYPQYEGVNAFRVDKMEDIIQEDKPCSQPPADFNLARHSRQVFNMFGGGIEYVELLCHNNVLTAVFDKFGKDVNILRFDDDHFKMTANVSVSRTFFGWIMQFGAMVKITYPKRVAAQFIAHLEEIQALYAEPH